nr:inositol monophosphatase family protein [Kineosporia babensis]
MCQLLADAADELTVAAFLTDLRVEQKADRTPVTEIDRAVETRVRELLAEHRPDDAVHGEEYADTGSSERLWVIDPIDGTKNYVRGVPVWASLISLQVGDELQAAVVSAPALNRRWWAAVGEGAWASWTGSASRRIRVSSVDRLEEASLSFSSLPGWNDLGLREAFLGLHETTWRQRGFGDFWSYMLVAEGAVDIAAEPEVPLYDLAAVSLIVTEAGGCFTSVHGRPGPTGGSALATNGHLHTTVLNALQEQPQ